MQIRSRALGALLFGVAVALLVAACGGTSLDDVTPAVGVTEIAVRDNRFDPRVIEVPAGTEVTWRWEDTDHRHNVIGDGLASETQRDGAFVHAFEAPGSYDVLCTLHGSMRGRVIVTP